MKLDAVEFIRRFLLHTLPHGFQRIRHYGFLANGVRKVKLPLCRQLLGQSREGAEDDIATADSAEGATSLPRLSTTCPACQEGHMQVIETWFAKRDVLEPPNPISMLDTS
jgi:Putative transposase